MDTDDETPLRGQLPSDQPGAAGASHTEPQPNEGPPSEGQVSVPATATDVALEQDA